MGTKVKVVIPIHRETLTPHERRSLRHNLEQLRRYPVAILCPEGMPLPAEAAGLETVRVSDEWLGPRNGIAGYNRMMLSRAFYDLFADCEYILICQPDVWIFRDELEMWCGRGYDCVGAPWPRKPLYERPWSRLWLRLRRRLASSSRILRSDLFDRVGNGGLSLRRVESFRRACDRYQATAERFLADPHPLYNEDVFWALVPAEFRYPAADEARRFAIDLKPELALQRNGGALPFGCHGWFRPERLAFWSRYIPN